MLKRGLHISLLFFMSLGLALGAAVKVSAAPPAQPQVPLAGNKIPQFVDPLPDLDVITAGAAQIELRMKEFQSKVLPNVFYAGLPAPAAGAPDYRNGTFVWGYLQTNQTSRASYLGPVIVAARGTPTEVNYVNNLPTAAASNLAWTYWTDKSLNWADPSGAPPTPGDLTHYAGPIPVVPHLHGGEVPAALDGGPDAWFLSDGSDVGHAYYSKDNLAKKNYAIYRYPNTQEAAPIWFHDHALGLTRLNVYAGLAGGYLITDSGAYPSNLPPLVPLVIQDRMFDVNGQLYFPNIGLNPEHPYWVPEFVGDTIVVNGKVWPHKTVSRQRYTFLFLNGSNARTYDMSLIDPVSGVRGPRMWVIGTDGGYLNNAVPVDPNSANKNISKSLVVMPGERYQAVIDFNDPAWVAAITAAYPNGVPAPLKLQLRNTAKTPFPGGAPANAKTTGRVLEFRVNWDPVPADTTFNPATTPAVRTTPMVRLSPPPINNPPLRRLLTLNEVMGPGGPLEVLVNNTKYDGTYNGAPIPGSTPYPSPAGNNSTYYTELPAEGTTEQWEIVNLTADAHPIHLHLVQFQLLNRQNFDLKKYNAIYNASFPGGLYIGGFGPPLNYTTGNPSALGGNPEVPLNLFKGAAVPPLPQEAGWKDTVVMYPGQVTRILVRWAPTDTQTAVPFPFNPDGGHGYVWHCHIIDHEDNEMMRPTQVQALNVSRTYVQGTDY
jgi:FtsP/CotA-like multicopper oxidase with cupredoxin domain